MVGVQTERRFTKKQMEWLVNGGNQKLRKAAEKLAKEADFYWSLTLPTDVIVWINCEPKAGGFYTFDRIEAEKDVGGRDFVEDFVMRAEKDNPNCVVQILSAKAFFQLRKDTGFLMIDWHGDPTGVQEILEKEAKLPEKLFPRGI